MTRSSRHLVDAELSPLLDAFPTVALTPEIVAERRTGESRLPLPPVSEAAAAVVQTRHVAPGPDGAPDITLLAYRPPEAAGPLPTLFHIHGGGYVMGSAEEVDSLNRERVADLGCMLISVNYRLAPETRAPGNVQDCYAGLAWVVANATTLGVDLDRLGVTGESAGGGLAAALTLLVRDRGEYRLAFQHLVYPMLDDRTCLDQDPHVSGEFIWTPHNNAFGWGALLGHEPGQGDVLPYAAPARATDLSGLPPAFITTGSLDLFVDEDIDYARRLNRAGVPTELHVYPGGFHGYDLHPTADISVRARRDSRDALQRFLFPKG